MIISEAVPSKNTHLRFHIALENVVFEYSGPFDTDTGEWIDSRAHFPLAGFQSCIDALSRMPKAEVAGTNGENLRFARRPDGTMDLILTGCKDGSDISVFGVNLTTWDTSTARVEDHLDALDHTTERYLGT
jgi:hypothetical protein